MVPSTFEENLDKTAMHAHVYVQQTARGKALEVYQRLAAEGDAPPRLVIGACSRHAALVPSTPGLSLQPIANRLHKSAGADTVVVSDGCVLEKPADGAAAVAMLTSLSGRSHEVSERKLVCLVSPHQYRPRCPPDGILLSGATPSSIDCPQLSKSTHRSCRLASLRPLDRGLTIVCMHVCTYVCMCVSMYLWSDLGLYKIFV